MTRLGLESFGRSLGKEDEVVIEATGNAMAVVRVLSKTSRDALAVSPKTMLTEAERQRVLALGADVEAAWNSSGATSTTRKRIIRTLIEEIVVRVEDDALGLVIRWAGGDHTCACERTAPASIAGEPMPTSLHLSPFWPANVRLFEHWHRSSFGASA